MRKLMNGKARHYYTRSWHCKLRPALILNLTTANSSKHAPPTSTSRSLTRIALPLLQPLPCRHPRLLSPRQRHTLRPVRPCSEPLSAAGRLNLQHASAQRRCYRRRQLEVGKVQTPSIPKSTILLDASTGHPTCRFGYDCYAIMEISQRNCRGGTKVGTTPSNHCSARSRLRRRPSRG